MVDGQVSGRTARTLFLAVGGLALGVLIGLVLGWYAFPVRWYDTDPSDMRLRHQMDYATMVADSFALNGDVERARGRLAELMDEDTSWEQVANLIARVAVACRAEGDTLAAVRLEALAAGAALPDPTLADYVAPSERVAGPRVGLILLGAAVFLFAAGALVWLVMRIGRMPPRPAARLAAERDQAPAAVAATREGDGGKGQEASTAQEGAGEHARAAEPSAMRWETVPQVSLDEDDADEDTLDVTELTADALVHVPALEDESDEPEQHDAPAAAEPEPDSGADDLDVEDEPEGQAEPPDTGKDLAGEIDEELVPELPEDALGVFQAEYVQGVDDFDCSFTIEDVDGTFLGECGVGIRDVLDVEGEQLVNAFEIWLFDKADIRTVSAVVVSEYAYEDEVLYTRLSAKGDLALAEEELVLTLETQTLALMATVTGFAYGEGGPAPNSHFDRFQVELVAERNPAA